MTYHPEIDFQQNKHLGADDNGRHQTPAAFGNSTFSSLRYPNFRWLLTSTIITNAAQWIQQITVSWLVYQWTGSGAMLGSLNVVRSVASMGVIPIAGNLIDQCDRKKLLILVNRYLFILTLVMGILLLLEYTFLWILFVFAFLAGTAQILNGTLRQVTVFDIVPRSETPNAVALIQTGWGVMRSFGPAVGGFLILWFGSGGNFLIQSGAYLLISLTFYRIHFPATNIQTSRSSFLTSLKVGITYVAKSPVTRAFTLMGFVLPLLIVPTYTVLSPIYAKTVFGGGPDTLGFLMSSIGVGGILGGVVSASLSRFERRGIVQLGALFFLSLTLIAFACSEKLWVALFFLGMSGFFEMIFITSNQTLLQLSIPDHLRGRVTSVVNLNFAWAPVGGILAGVGADLFGSPRPVTMVLAGIASMVAILTFLFSSSIRDFRMSKVIVSDDK